MDETRRTRPFLTSRSLNVSRDSIPLLLGGRYTRAMSRGADWQSLYPFQPHYLSVAGHRYHYIDEGNGPPILLVHGNPTWSFLWRNLVLALRNQYRTIAVDHLGCGLSDKPAEDTYTIVHHTSRLVTLLRQLDLRDVCLVVHDWGGAIGLGAALAEPARVSRLILFNTGAFPPPYFPWRIRVCRTPILGRVAVQGVNAFARAALTMAMEEPSRLSRAERAGMIAPYNSWRHRRAIYEFVADIPAGPAHPTWSVLARLENELPQLAHLPCRIVWGMRDWCFRPECLDRIAAILPRAEITRIAHAGHWVMEDARDEVIAHVREFLAQSNPVAARQTPS